MGAEEVCRSGDKNWQEYTGGYEMTGNVND